MKNLYLVKRNERVGWDEYDSFIVCAKSEQDARETSPNKFDGKFDKDNSDYSWVCFSEICELDVKLIGKANDGLEYGVVLSSFNAG